MAIKRKSNKPSVSVPSVLDNACTEGFTLSLFEKEFKALSKDKRDEIKRILETSDVEIESGKGFKVSNGSITFVETTRYDYDTAMLAEMINDGKIDAYSVLSAATFKKDEMKAALGSDFDDVAKSMVTDSLRLNPSANFKVDFQNQFDSIFSDMSPESEAEAEEDGGDIDSLIIGEAEKQKPKRKAKRKTKRG